MSCGVGRRHGLTPMLLWLWCRPAATAPIRPLVWEPPYAVREALEKEKRQKRKKAKKKKKKNPVVPLMVLGARHKFTDSGILINRTPSRIDIEKFTIRHIIVTLLKIKDKSIQRKRHSVKRTMTRMLINFSSKQ